MDDHGLRKRLADQDYKILEIQGNVRKFRGDFIDVKEKLKEAMFQCSANKDWAIELEVRIKSALRSGKMPGPGASDSQLTHEAVMEVFTNRYMDFTAKVNAKLNEMIDLINSQGDSIRLLVKAQMKYEQAYYHVFPDRLAQDAAVDRQLDALKARKPDGGGRTS